MSVSVEQPLHFSQQPSSPPFSSPPHSPNHLLHTSTPVDVDMSSSIATLAPAGQRHDRDADMQDGEVLTNGQAEDQPIATSDHGPIAETVAVEVAAVDEDVMDTTVDSNADVVLANGSVDPMATTTPTSPPANGVATEEPVSNEQAPPEAPPANDTQTQDEVTPSLHPPPPPDPTSHPPPPPPPVEPVRSDSDSSDEDDGLQPWHPIQEDTSSPDEAELKEIEASTEHSALDHEYWEGKAFLPLEAPEYTAGESGRVNWQIDAYNGTRESPNRDLVMKSDVVTVGGHQWQIKFYPKGNDSDYLSVYLECLSVMDPKKDEQSESTENAPQEETASKEESKEQDKMETTDHVPAPPSATPESHSEPQHAPLPLLGSKTVPKRKSVAAQVSVVLYNPTEPRVNYSRTALHRFCSGSPDWGWTRFHGPYYDIAHRMRGHRSALLRDDKLAFTGYIRIVDDETNCLWEHHSQENPWDSFAMTGLQSLALGEDASAPGGNMISAVASWMLFKPFRSMLYSIKVPESAVDPFIQPKPLIAALQKVLYLLRTQVDPGAGAIPLDDVLDALEWYGIQERLDKLDVIEVWEILRSKLEEELQGTEQAGALLSLFGPKRDYSTSIPTYRVPVVGVETMQTAVNSSMNLLAPGLPLPQLLTIELDRQAFDVKTRSYVKVLNKVTLDDRLTINNTNYTLYGFVVHKQTLQSYVYQPIIRPEGPETRWYSYSDSKDENQVKCLTKRQAIDDHEGKPGKDQVVGNDAVAYIAMYVRDDLSQAVFTSDVDSEQWVVPEWVRAEVEKEKSSVVPPPPPPPPAETPSTEPVPEEKPMADENEEKPTMLDFQVIDSRIFKAHEGPGIFNAYDPKWKTGEPEHMHNVQIATNSSCTEIAETLSKLFPDVQDRRQVLFWFVDPTRGSLGRPQLLGAGKTSYARFGYEHSTEDKDWKLSDSSVTCHRIWVHIRDFADLPELPKPEVKQPEAEDAVPAPPPAMEMEAEITQLESDVPAPPPVMEMEAETTQVESDAPVPPQPETHTEDTPMSEPDNSAILPVEPPVPVADAPPLSSSPPPPVGNTSGADTAMVEVESAAVPDPPAVDVVVPEEPVVTGDTEMGGTQEELPLPPPPPISIPPELVQPPPPERARTPEPPPEEIYFFLKLWDPEKQVLESRGSHFCLKSTRVDEKVVTLLGHPLEDKRKIELWEEEELVNTRPIKHRRSFAQLDLQNATIIIAALPITAEQRSALADRTAFADPKAYLAFRSFARNFPEKLNGHFTYDYFSGQYYKGEIKNGHKQGHGMQIYHSGATYSGSFRLGQRHGHGLYTFQNGDTYDGDWVDNQQHGSGTFVESATGNTYVGGWKQDKKFGEGVTHWKNAQEAERMCRICWDEPAEAAFYDCGHVVACLGCAREVQNCPVCRKRVLSAMKLYYVA